METKQNETTKILLTLATWQYDWLKSNTTDDVTKEIRRAVKAWITTREQLKLVNQK